MWADEIEVILNGIDVDIQQLETTRQKIINECNHTFKSGKSALRKDCLPDDINPYNGTMNNWYNICTICKRIL